MSGPIRKDDTVEERMSKLLPADVTAAFLSAKAGLVTAYGDGGYGYVFWTFVAILAICPLYFWFVTKAKNYFQISFLCGTFLVFALSIASKEFAGYLQGLSPRLAGIGPVIDVISIVLPTLWVFLITRIFLEAMGSKVERTR
jgi:hypothetical protein